MNRRLFSVSPVATSFATPYSSGDVIGAVTEIPTALLDDGASALLKSLVALDKSNSKVALDVLFFNQQPVNSLGADNAAYALNDADLSKLLGRIGVAGADYVSSSTLNAEATYKNIDLVLEGVAKSKSLWMVVVARGAITLGSVGDLTFKVGLDQS